MIQEEKDTPMPSVEPETPKPEETVEKQDMEVEEEKKPETLMDFQKFMQEELEKEKETPKPEIKQVRNFISFLMNRNQTKTN